MKKLTVELEDDEYLQSLEKKGSRTCREVYLSALGIECKDRVIGRPSSITMDALRDKIIKDGQERVRKFREWELNEKIAESTPKAEAAARALGLYGGKDGEMFPALGVSTRKKSKG